MAMSKCMKCDSLMFEIVEKEPANSLVKMFFVQCSICGGVVGAIPYHDTSTLLAELAKKLGVQLDI